MARKDPIGTHGCEHDDEDRGDDGKGLKKRGDMIDRARTGIGGSVWGIPALRKPRDSEIKPSDNDQSCQDKLQLGPRHYEANSTLERKFQ